MVANRLYHDDMVSITIPALDEDAMEVLRKRAERNGRTIEEEAREILNSAARAPAANLADAIRVRFAPFGGVELPEVPRGQAWESPAFE
jgi:plasmid stability protein